MSEPFRDEIQILGIEVEEHPFEFLLDTYEFLKSRNWEVHLNIGFTPEEKRHGVQYTARKRVSPDETLIFWNTYHITDEKFVIRGGTSKITHAEFKKEFGISFEEIKEAGKYFREVYNTLRERYGLVA